MSNHQLETALMYAGQANDIASLKALARHENLRADKFGHMLSAVLAVSGPVTVRGNINDLRTPGFSVTAVDDYVIFAAAPQPQEGDQSNFDANS